MIIYPRLGALEKKSVQVKVYINLLSQKNARFCNMKRKDSNIVIGQCNYNASIERTPAI